MAIKEHDWTLTDEAVGKAVNTTLARLEHNLHDPNYARSLRRSSLERSKATANLEYAQTLLARLEQINTTTHPSRQNRQKAQDIVRQRDLVKQCQDRLHSIALDASTGNANESADENADDEDTQELLRRFAPKAQELTGTQNEQKPNAKQTEASDPPLSQEQAKDTPTTSTLRSRHTNAQPLISSSQPKSPTTATTTSSQPTLFAPKPTSNTNSNTALLETHASTQEDLTASLLDLARALNASTKSFSTSLESSNPLVDIATAALDKNVSGMEAAERRMGMLRRMTEGKGWFGRLSLWGWIAVGWVVLLGVMFVLPKLRL